MKTKSGRSRTIQNLLGLTWQENRFQLTDKIERIYRRTSFFFQTAMASAGMQGEEDKVLQYRPARNSRRFSRLFREKPEFNGANTLSECVVHSEAYNKASHCWITARKRYMSTPFEGAWTVTIKLCKIEIAYDWFSCSGFFAFRFFDKVWFL